MEGMTKRGSKEYYMVTIYLEEEEGKLFTEYMLANNIRKKADAGYRAIIKELTEFRKTRESQQD